MEQQHHPVRAARRQVQTHGTAVARSAAWFSIVLGVAELAAPHAVARACGLRPGSAAVVRMCGLRELITGVGLLRARNAAPWLWGRAAGDALDAVAIASLAERSSLAPLAKAAGTVLAVGAVGGADLFAAQHYKQPRRSPPPWHDYRDRSGFPQGLQRARGAARDASIPADVLTPPALRRWADPETEPAV
ncbi:hypothetical protein FOZ76_21570 [Verticiella sediminum]|uniref:Cyclase dehydrase n=1 Tax=Verticiella sediminum TaxID=1247510 RepID=A0A556AC13_9BURK|nr:hypothetical protein [Verticiella sediminum]TSH90413.1 hypothetical protein FOZ76_21570 [Verticiella sediminum]